MPEYAEGRAVRGHARHERVVGRARPQACARSRTANQILANPLYRNITRRFAQGHDYIAMERLYELHEEGEYDLLVVDTPPSLNALDLLDAPGRMAEFFSSRLLRWLVVPYRSRLVNFASRPFYQVADRILGSQFLEDLAGFFILFQTMRDGFVARAEAVNRLLRDVRTTFVVVTTLEAVPAVDAEQLIESLRERHLHLGLLVCNKVLPGLVLGSTRRPDRRARWARRRRAGGVRCPPAAGRPCDLEPSAGRDGRPGARRSGPQLRQLPARGDTRGRAAAGAVGGARGDGDRAVPPGARHRPARSSRRRRQDLGRRGQAAGADRAVFRASRRTHGASRHRSWVPADRQVDTGATGRVETQGPGTILRRRAEIRRRPLTVFTKRPDGDSMISLSNRAPSRAGRASRVQHEDGAHRCLRS